jgi:hypothetical protein
VFLFCFLLEIGGGGGPVLAPPEVLVVAFRRSWWSFLRDFFLCFVLALAVLVVALREDGVHGVFVLLAAALGV